MPLEKAQDFGETPAGEEATNVPDTVFLAAVDEVITHRTRGKIRGLHITMDGDVFVLQGYASTYYMKQIATHAAIDVNAVPYRNEISVG
jgi:hypothetical protein